MRLKRKTYSNETWKSMSVFMTFLGDSHVELLEVDTSWEGVNIK